MKHSKFELNESDLQAYVDDNLDPARSEEILRYLDNHPEEFARIAAYKQQNNLLQTLYDQTDEALLQRVRKNYEKYQLDQKHLFTSLPYVASITWLIIGVFIGWGFNMLNSPENSITFNLPQSAMIAHTVFSPEVRHPVEVKADQETHLVKWLSKRLKRKLNAPNLNSLGYALIGGRLLPAQQEPAAQFMYENKSGDRVTLYVIAQSAKDSTFKFFERNNIKVFSWNNTNTGFAIVGSIHKQQLLKVANMIYSDI